MKHTLFNILAIFALISVISCKDTSSESKSDAVLSQSAVTSISTKSPSKTSDKVSEGLDWYTMNDVEALVKQDQKKILVDVYTQWCGPCKMMDKKTFTNPDVQKAINEKFHAVKFDAEGADSYNFKGKDWANPNHDPNKRGRNAKHELANFFSVRGYPTLVVLDENFNILQKVVGYKTPEQLLAEIKNM